MTLTQKTQAILCAAILISTAGASAQYAPCPTPTYRARPVYSYSTPVYRSYIYDTGRSWAGYGDVHIYGGGPYGPGPYADRYERGAYGHYLPQWARNHKAY